MEKITQCQEIHLSHFTEKTLFRLLESNDFTVEFATLDRYYGSTGLSRFRRDLLYALFLLVRKLTGKNLYEAMLVVARKKI
jgi:hypothetical protein